MAGFNPFGSVPVPKKKRTNFNESFELSGNFPLSKLCPVCFIDSLPGSSWKVNVFNLTKLETLIAPAMQRVNASILWFKMPKRLLFRYFDDWYSGGEDGQDEHQKPYVYLKEVADAIYTKIYADHDSDAVGILDYLTKFFFGPGTLWNYMGLPVPIDYNGSTGVWEVLSIDDWDFSTPDNPDDDFVDLIPLMGYNFLFDTYFRDQTLQDSIFTKGEKFDFSINRGYYSDLFLSNGHTYRVYVGPEAKYKSRASVTDIKFFTTDQNLAEGGKIVYQNFLALLQLFNRAWKKDYFTSALPTPQRGPEVTMNLVGTAPVSINQVSEISLINTTGNGVHLDDPQITADASIYQNDPLSVKTSVFDGTPTDITFPDGATLNKIRGYEGSEFTGEPIFKQNNVVTDNLAGVADLSGLSPITITALRNLFKLQSFLEKNNISGGRYIETILAHWGERIPDFTVQRPQFIRATSIPVQISEVTATANSTGTSSIVGDQAGRGRTQGNLGKVRIYTQEPSLIFGLYCVTAPPSYAGQGIPRQFQHVTRFDEPWPDFQHIGEQAIKTRELYYPFDTDNYGEDFGYQQRFSEYKFMPDRVVGDFQTSLAFWHMARMFTASPKLNESFVSQHLDPRIFAVQSGRPVTASFYFEASAKLKLSKYSTPKLT